jgi:hypothetical protein
MLAGRLTGAAAPIEPIARRRTQAQGDRGGVDFEAESLAVEVDLGRDVNLVLAALGDQPVPFGSEKLRGLNEAQARQGVEERKRVARLRHSR